MSTKLNYAVYGYRIFSRVGYGLISAEDESFYKGFAIVNSVLFWKHFG